MRKRLCNKKHELDQLLSSSPSLLAIILFGFFFLSLLCVFSSSLFLVILFALILILSSYLCHMKTRTISKGYPRDQLKPCHLGISYPLTN